MFLRVLMAAITMGMLSSAVSAGTVTSGFGYRVDPMGRGMRHHAGMDIAARTGTPVFATGSGYIYHAGWLGSYGILVKVSHANGYETRFGHLSRAAVVYGQFVVKGQLLGYIGSTGRSTGPHLHYEVRFNNVPQNPRSYM